jgi:hypothetical protein
MRFILFSLITSICFFQILAQSKKNTEKKNEKRPIEIQNLVNDASFLPPEIATHSLIKISRSSKIKNNKWKQEILEEAFRLTDKVQNPYKKRAVPFSGVSVDTKSGYLSYAFDQKLDEISLKSEIILEMSALNKPRSKEMLTSIGNKLSFKPISCEETLVYDVSDFYKTVSKIVKDFSVKEIKEGSRMLFILQYVENFDSHVQIKPILDLLISIQPTTNEKITLGSSFLTSLKTIKTDDRSFTFTVERERIISILTKFVSIYEQDENLLFYKDYVLKHSNNPRCQENTINDESNLPRYIQDINSILDDKPITFEDVKTKQTDNAAKIENYWQTQNAKKISKQFTELRLQKKELDTFNWQSKLAIFLDELEKWKAENNETDNEIFNQKCVMYSVLIDLVKNSDFEKQVLKSYLQYLNNSDMQSKSVFEWYFYVKKLTNSNINLFTNDNEIPFNSTFLLLRSLKNTQI